MIQFDEHVTNILCCISDKQPVTAQEIVHFTRQASADVEHALLVLFQHGKIFTVGTDVQTQQLLYCTMSMVRYLC